MTENMYKIWAITGMVVLLAGIPFFYPDLGHTAAYVAGAGITFINVLLLGKGISALFGRSGKRPVFLFLLILKYAFLLTTLYIAIVIIKLQPLPFVLGITVLPVSTMIMGIFFMLRRRDNA
jgi:hypothetical protein